MPIVDAVRAGEAVWIESCVDLERRYPRAFQSFSTGREMSMACLPLLARGRCVGGLVFIFEGARSFLADQRAFLKVLAWHAAQALERTHVYAAERQARAKAEAAQQRSEFMADASLILNETLDLEATARAVARAAVPRIADWCIVEFAESGVARVAAHVEPAKEPYVLELIHRFREADGARSGIASVMKTGRSEIYRVIDVAFLEAHMTGAPDLAKLYAETGLVSSMVVPIQARTRTIGAIVLNSTTPTRHYDEHDLRFAEDLGRRIGLAVENARLFREARDADRRKDEFLAMLSHELRNPLAPIVTTLGLMERRDRATFANERAMISRNVQRIVRMVDDLLEVSRITRGDIELHREHCEVAGLVADALEMAGPLLTARSQRVTVSVPESGLGVHGDRARLAQVIANLINNAARYTEPGGHIVIDAHADGADAVLRVRDSGRGIPKDAQATIFDLFVQVDTSLARSHGGLGIGLTVVKTLVESHGGSVRVFSEGPGKGSEFVVRIPLQATRDARAESASRVGSVRTDAATGLRVLVVDDNRDLADAMTALLADLGCTARVAYDGPAALGVVDDFEPDLALVDIGLPGMDGYELARLLRQQSHTLRLMAISGYGNESDRALTRDAGFDEHLVKPVSTERLEELLSAIRASPTHRAD
jgi:signal transduction histidine kinase/ActR/RegA family two-component response regulator